jgi:hypothetical protein
MPLPALLVAIDLTLFANEMYLFALNRTTRSQGQSEWIELLYILFCYETFCVISMPWTCLKRNLVFCTILSYFYFSHILIYRLNNYVFDLYCRAFPCFLKLIVPFRQFIRFSSFLSSFLLPKPVLIICIDHGNN